MTQGNTPGDQFPSGSGNGRTEEDEQTPVIRDRRRIDPNTGEIRPDSTSDSPADAEVQVETATKQEAELARQLAERTADLQRLQAEYLNYKRRVDRDKQAAKDNGVASVLIELLPVLDDIGRARQHNELSGGFRAVAEALESVVTKLGLEKYGEPGDPFDPRVHEAMMHSYSDEVVEPTNTAILQPGYRYSERVLRAARVAVAEPTETLPASSQPASEDVAEAGAADADESEQNATGQGGPGQTPPG